MTENLARRGSMGDGPDHPWLTHYPKDIAWDQPIAAAPLAELFEEAARRFANRPCLDFLGRRYSYAEVLGLVNRAAKGFAALGVKPGGALPAQHPDLRDQLFRDPEGRRHSGELQPALCGTGA